ELLRATGEMPPTKNGKNGEIPAFARTDEYMQQLTERDDYVGDLAKARLDCKSTLKETRAAKLAEVSRRGPLPIYLNYCSAATTRWSGSDLNPQNLPREVGLRQCYKAKPGYKLVIADFNQIELRILCGLAGQTDKLDALREGKDIYREFASHLYGVTPENVTDDQRKLGKTAVLGCGYGQGKDKFAKVCRNAGLDLDHELTDDAVECYRACFGKVCEFWRRCDGWLMPLSSGSSVEILGRLWINHNCVCLPNGIHCPFVLRWAPGKGWMR